MRITTPSAVPMTYCDHHRSSLAWYFDRTGVLRTAAVDVVRYTYDPDTLKFGGVLIEPRRTNYVPNNLVYVNQTFSVSVPGGHVYGVMSFYGEGQVKLTSSNPMIPSAGITLGDGVPWRRKYKAFVIGNSSSEHVYTFQCTGFVMYLQLEMLTTDDWVDLLTSDPSTLQIDGQQLDHTLISNPYYTVQLLTPTSPIITGDTPYTREADELIGYGVIASTLQETAQAWEPDQTYVMGAEAISGMYVYESLTEENWGKPPPDSPNHWLLVRTDNRYAFLDLMHGGKATAEGVCRLAVRVPRYTPTVSLVDILPGELEPGQVSVCATHLKRTGQFTWSTHVSASADEWIPDTLYFDTFTDVHRPVQFRADIISIDISTRRHASGAPIIPTDRVGLGELVVGDYFFAGDAELRVGLRVIDWSKKEVNNYGDFTVKQGAFSKRLDVTVLVPHAKYNQLIHVLKQVRSSPTLWCVSDIKDLSSGMIVFGMYRDAEIVVRYKRYSLLNIQLESFV